MFLASPERVVWYICTVQGSAEEKEEKKKKKPRVERKRRKEKNVHVSTYEFNPLAPSHRRTSSAQCYRKNELEKEMLQRALGLEKWS